MTRDERFLVELYKQLEENIEKSINPKQVANELGFNERLTKNILRGLMQANFVRWASQDEIEITQRGIEALADF